MDQCHLQEESAEKMTMAQVGFSCDGNEQCSHLLGLNSSRVLLAETQFCDGNIIQDDVEVSSSLNQLTPHQQRNLQQTLSFHFNTSPNGHSYRAHSLKSDIIPHKRAVTTRQTKQFLRHIHQD